VQQELAEHAASHVAVQLPLAHVGVFAEQVLHAPPWLPHAAALSPGAH